MPRKLAQPSPQIPTLNINERSPNPPNASLGYDFTQRKAVAIARRRKAFELSVAGMTLRQIAAELGLKSIGYVSKLIDKEGSIPGPGTTAARAIECAKLDERERLQRTALSQAMVKGEDGKTRISSEQLEKFDVAMNRIAMHRSKIMGLDAPIKISEAMNTEWNVVLDDLQRDADSETYERVLGIIARRQEGGAGAPTNSRPGAGSQSTH
jgi:hypothetical protein